jgi:hypothetical protein
MGEKMFKKIAIMALLTLLFISIVSCGGGKADAGKVNHNPDSTSVENAKYNVNVEEFISNVQGNEYSSQDTVRISGDLVKKVLLDLTDNWVYELTLKSGEQALTFWSKLGTNKADSVFNDFTPLSLGSKVTLEVDLQNLEGVKTFLEAGWNNNIQKYLKDVIVVK